MKIGKPFEGFIATIYPQGSITQYFGVNAEYYKNVCPLEGKCLKAHNGIDFIAPWGTPLLAVEDGIVEDLSDIAGGYGRHVRILSGENEWVYGHLSKISVTKRQIVKKGDVIGNMGNTGLVFPTPSVVNPLAGTHLHLGLRKKKGGVVQNYDNGYFGSIDFADMLPSFDLVNSDVVGFVGLLKKLLVKLQAAGIEVKIPNK